MRQITEIILHCTATPEGREVTVDEVEQWHKQRGFKCIGYHYLIHLDGTVSNGRDLNMVGAHCKGHNQQSIGICYVGGLSSNNKPKDTRTAAQRAALRDLLKKLLKEFPNATVHTHSEFAAKDCPCFTLSEL